DDLVRVGPHTSQSAEPMRAHAVFETPSANLAGTPIPFAGRASAPPADSNKAPSNPASGLHAERVPPETDFSESGRQHPGFGEPGLPMARVVAQSARSEMHIGMRTSEFGSVEVHTVVRDSQVGISIAAEKGDLRSLLSAEVPAMQTRLGQQELHLEEVKFLPQGASVNVPDAQTGSRQQSFQQQQAPPPGVAANHGREAKEIDVAFTTIGNTAVSPGVRRSLSIHI
ncbi:MAG TPA: flagellar hook-length control protein FliK, partial [Terriglobales bacterium]|nr:flagellar hook-length control protein FliK [Terriglobales bacterium]